jgi:hypothetical protein
MSEVDEPEKRPSSLQAEIDRLRSDPEFVALVDRLIDEERDILERLAER